MKKFRYQITGPTPNHELQGQLDRAGEDGWELVSDQIEIQHEEQGALWRMIFKKEVNEVRACTPIRGTAAHD